MKGGIKNMSRTKYMSAGAAFGNGVYVSNTTRVSASYSSSCNVYIYLIISAQYWPGSKLGNSLSCIAIVQVPEGKYNTGNSNIFVV